MCVPTKYTVKLSNGNTVHNQSIETILCYICNFPITYPVGPVYYFLCHHYNSISLDALKVCVDFKKVTSEPLEHCDFVDPQGRSWRSPYQTRNNLDYLQLEIVKINPHREKNPVVPTVCGLSKQNLSQLIHQRFGHVSITRLKRMARRGLMDGLPENLPELEEPCPICLLTKATKISRCPTTDVSKFAPGFMLQMDVSFFIVESICGFTCTFVTICYNTSHHFVFPPRGKFPLIDIIKFLFNTLSNQNKKIVFARLD